RRSRASSIGLHGAADYLPITAPAQRTGQPITQRSIRARHPLCSRVIIVAQMHCLRPVRTYPALNLAGSKPRKISEESRSYLVTPAGFEPAISTLKGSRPGPG